jgi:hypothetical protein
VFERIRDFYLEWRNTGVGKVVRDFFWSVVGAGIATGIAAVYAAVITNGEVDPRMIANIFYVGCLTGAVKAASYFVKQYQSDRPLTPNS